jgi:hypothetical protein
VSGPASREGILLGCSLLLQMWIHEWFDISQPRADLSEYELLPDGTDLADLPTMGSPWCLRKVITSLIVFSCYDLFSSIHLTFHVLCSTFGLGAAEEGVQGLRWSNRPDGRCPGPVDAVHSCHGLCPHTTWALALCSQDQAYWMTRR